MWSNSTGHLLQRIVGFRCLIRTGLFRRSMLLVLHEIVVSLLNLMLLEVGQASRLLLLSVTPLGLLLAALRL